MRLFENAAKVPDAGNPDLRANPIHPGTKNWRVRIAKRIKKVTPITEQQVSVLRFIALGASTKEAAFEMKISPKTVEHHRDKLKAKLNIHSNAELARFASDNGYIKKGERFVSTDSKPKPTGPLKLLGTGKITDALVLASDRIASAMSDKEIVDPVSVDSLVKIADCLCNITRLEAQLHHDQMAVPWLNSIKRIENIK